MVNKKTTTRVTDQLSKQMSMVELRLTHNEQMMEKTAKYNQNYWLMKKYYNVLKTRVFEKGKVKKRYEEVDAILKRNMAMKGFGEIWALASQKRDEEILSQESRLLSKIDDMKSQLLS